MFSLWCVKSHDCVVQYFDNTLCPIVFWQELHKIKDELYKTKEEFQDLTDEKNKVVAENTKLKDEKTELEKKVTRSNNVLQSAKNKLQALKEANEKLTAERLEMRKKLSSNEQASAGMLSSLLPYKVKLLSGDFSPFTSDTCKKSCQWQGKKCFLRASVKKTGNL